MQPVGDNFYDVRGNDYYQRMFDLFSMMGSVFKGGHSPIDFARSVDFRHRKRSANYRRAKHRSKR